MSHRAPFSLLLAGVFLTSVLAAGCAGVNNRREARRGAFEPLRPEPQNRLIPNDPVKLPTPLRSSAQEKKDARQIAAAQAATKEASGPAQGQPPATAAMPATAATVSIKLPADLAASGLTPGISRFNSRTLEVYFSADRRVTANFLAIARNAASQEIGRVAHMVELAPDQAGLQRWIFPEIVSGETVASIELIRK